MKPAMLKKLYPHIWNRVSGVLEDEMKRMLTKEERRDLDRLGNRHIIMLDNMIFLSMYEIHKLKEKIVETVWE